MQAHNLTDRNYVVFTNMTLDYKTDGRISRRAADTERNRSDSITHSYKNPTQQVKSKINCCPVCKKKVGLTGLHCCCGGIFCGCHQNTDQHSCTVNYWALGTEEVCQNNPQVVAEKLERI